MALFDKSFQSEVNKESGGFFRPSTGSNLVRIVSDFAQGFRFDFDNREEGAKMGHPTFRLDDPFVKENRHKLRLSAQCVVFNYQTGQLESWDINQKTILKSLSDYAENPKYGDPKGYDLLIKAEGMGKDVRYSVQANPPEPASEEVITALEGKAIKIDNVFEGKNPIVDA